MTLGPGAAPTIRMHVDTDFGGDPDDACAVAMLLGWPNVELVGITTNLDRGGERAGCAAHLLSLVSRLEVPLAAGAAATLTEGKQWPSTCGDARYWSEPVAPRPSPPGAMLELLQRSIVSGATIVAIGAFTNLALLEILAPGSLRDVPVVATAGWLTSPGPGYPPWGTEMDFNVRCDPRAAQIVLDARPALTLVTLPASMEAQLRAADLPRLEAAGPVGTLLARQAQAVANEFDNFALGRVHAALPDDLLNFHWDPVTCAVAAGWSGCTVVEQRVAFDPNLPGLLCLPEGHLSRVVVDIDADAFRETWLGCIERLAHDARLR